MAEQGGSLRTERRSDGPVEIVSPILRGRAGIGELRQVALTLQRLGAWETG